MHFSLQAHARILHVTIVNGVYNSLDRMLSGEGLDVDSIAQSLLE